MAAKADGPDIAASGANRAATFTSNRMPKLFSSPGYDIRKLDRRTGATSPIALRAGREPIVVGAQSVSLAACRECRLNAATFLWRLAKKQVKIRAARNRRAPAYACTPKFVGTWRAVMRRTFKKSSNCRRNFLETNLLPSKNR